MAKLRIIVAQLNFWVGDIQGNTQKIIDAIQTARDEWQADLVVFPELAICGYPPEDLLLRSDFHQQIKEALQIIQQHAIGIDVLLGYPHHTKEGMYNAACLIRQKKLIATYHKQCLPNYGVFDEQRYFITGNKPCVFTIKNTKIGLIICEDTWHPEPIAQAVKKGAKLIISINASPFDLQKSQQREKILLQRTKENKVPIIYAHRIGAQDDLVFDGGSKVISAQGKICAHAGFFQEKLFPIDIQLGKTLKIQNAEFELPLSNEAKIYQALVLAVRDYVTKNNFPGALIGVSGGIDSALTLAIAVDALGKERVHAALLPSRYTSELSTVLSIALVEKLGVKTSNISIEPVFQAFLKSLEIDFKNLPKNVTEENIQARCRGTLLMALSNKTGKILLNTSNKSELATGYGTLYGDMAGGYAVLKDVPKTLVFKLAEYRNSISSIIPEEIITRPPTAELAANQKDEDTLPPYDTLDPILEMYVEQDKSFAEIVAAGFDKKIVERVIKMVDCNEYKRRQAAPGPRITIRAFGRERRYPMTSKFVSWN